MYVMLFKIKQRPIEQFQTMFINGMNIRYVSIPDSIDVSQTLESYVSLLYFLPVSLSLIYLLRERY